MATIIEPSLLDAALDYARKGLPVFPCQPDTKTPLTKNGLKNASTDEQVIASWWTKHPDAMIGMVTGSRSGLWVLDIDDPALFTDALAFELPETRRSTTGKGWHGFFRFNPESPVHNRQKHPKAGWPFPDLPGAETRGEGGYVILPPSLHRNGRRYEWTCDAPVVEAPAALLKIVQASRQAATKQAAPAEVSGSDKKYGLAALEAECGHIQAAGNGEQESALNEASLKIGSLVAGGELSLNTARSRLVAAGLAMPSYDSRNCWTVDAVRQKVERGLADGAAKPRSAPEKPAVKVKQRALKLVASNPDPDGNPHAASDGRPFVQIRAGAVAAMATIAEQVLINHSAPIYDRGGLVRPVLEEVPASKGRRTSVACLVEVDDDMLVDHMSRAANWLKFDGRSNDWVPTDPPRSISGIIRSRRGEWAFSRLLGVITTPTLRPDGTILDAGLR
jgi:hypothetical protein